MSRAGEGRSPGRPKRSLGQNFLVDRGIAARIVEAAGVRAGEVVLEIGPGRGALTEGLADATDRAGGRLVLVELDDLLAEELRERFRDRPHVAVLHRDILSVPLSEVTPDVGALKVVGNIPYNVTSSILFHLLTPPRPREIFLMVQKEVAERIMAEPGSSEFGALTVGVRAVAQVEGVLRVSPGAFRPRPRVDSRVIRILPHHPPRMTGEEEAALRDLTRALFQWRRKQLGKILRDHPDLGLSPEGAERLAAAAGAAVTDRPETVSPDGFIAMVRALGTGQV
jgi:16S rRNA (adenine1518-N6/adenine1519-N6)-dimethyltransferase